MFKTNKLMFGHFFNKNKRALYLQPLLGLLVSQWVRLDQEHQNHPEPQKPQLDQCHLGHPEQNIHGQSQSQTHTIKHSVIHERYISHLYSCRTISARRTI